LVVRVVARGAGRHIPFLNRCKPAKGVWPSLNLATRFTRAHHRRDAALGTATTAARTPNFRGLLGSHRDEIRGRRAAPPRWLSQVHKQHRRFPSPSTRLQNLSHRADPHTAI
jgi:hypothetical protein